MAIVAGTQLRFDVVGEKESIEDTIYRISPEDTPLMSMIGRTTVPNTLHQWQIDALAAAATNAQLEGDQAAFSTPTQPTIVGNYSQISSKTLLVSGTLEQMNLYGRKSEVGLQQAKRAAELKLDMEFAYFQNVAGAVGTAVVSRKLAGLPVWLKTNTVFGAGGADSAYASGVPTPARTDGAQVAFTKANLDTVIQAIWTAGGKPQVVMCGPFNRTVFSTFTGLATNVVDVKAAAPTYLVDSLDVYVNDFGKVRVIPNRLQRERDVYVIDPKMLAVGYFRPFAVKPLAIDGDQAAKKLLVVEHTLIVKNEAGLGAVFDVTES